MSARALAGIGLLATVVAQPAVAGLQPVTAPTDSPLNIWSSAQYSEGDQHRRGGVQGYEVQIQGGGVGVDGRLSDSWRLGLRYRAQQAELKQAGHDVLHIDGEFVRATASFTRERFAFELGLTGGEVEHDDRLSAPDSTGTVLGADAQWGYRYPLQGTVVVEPLIQLRYARSELNGSQPLQEIGEAGIGVRWSGYFQAGPGRVEQRIQLMALRDYLADSNGTITLLMLGDQAVVTHPERPQRHSYQAALGLSYYLGPLVLSAGYDYLERSGYYADSLSVAVRYDF